MVADGEVPDQRQPGREAVTTRVPPLTDTSPRGLSAWAGALVLTVQGVINRLSVDVQLGRVRTYEVSSLPDASGPCRIIFVSDETGGGVLAFNDGQVWRRCTDRAVVS